GFGQRGRVGDRERHVQQPRQRLGQQRLAAAGRSDQQDVRFGKLDVVFLSLVIQTLVMIVYGDRELLLGVLLTDHVFVQDRVDLLRNGQTLTALGFAAFGDLLADDVVAQLDAFVTDEHAWTGDQLPDLVLT